MFLDRKDNMIENTKIYFSLKDWFHNEETPIVFLCGVNNKWHNEIIEKITNMDLKAAIACPKYEIANSEDYGAMTSWDLYHIRMASSNGVIVFWCGKDDNYATLLFNLGEWIQNVKYRKIYQPERLLKLIIGIESGFILEKYIMFRMADELPEHKVYFSIDSVGSAIIEELKQLNEK